MRERPDIPFFVRPSDYQIIDGDTVRILTPERDENNKRIEAFRIRFPNINTPEIPKPGLTDSAFLNAGIDPHKDAPGRISALRLREMCKGRCLLFIPEVVNGSPKEDRYRRLIATPVISGSPGRLFEIRGAFDAERRLHDEGLGTLMPGRNLPPIVPRVLEVLKRELQNRNIHDSVSPS